MARPIMIFLVICLSRLPIYHLFGIRPNPGYLISHWQHLSLSDLDQNLTLAILNLHSQPPLWNALLGLAAKACDAEASCVAQAIHFMNIGLTGLIALMIASVLVAFGLTRNGATLIALLYAVMPSTIYYENYPFYPHFICFLITASLFFALRYFDRRGLGDLALSLLSITLLSWTWGLFHPVVMTLTMLMIYAMGGRKSLPALACTLAFAAALYLPSVKNQMVFGFFGNSSWLGLNVAQVAPEAIAGCSFGGFLETVPDTAHQGTAFNDPAIIPYAADCLGKAKDSITGQPVTYATDLAFRFLKNARLTPSDYFFPPHGFEHYPRIAGKHPLHLEDGSLNLIGIALSSVILLVNLTLYAAVAVSFFVLPRPFNKAGAVAAVYLCLIAGVAFMLNSGEQERMKHSLGAVLFVTFWLLIRAAIPALRRRFGRGRAMVSKGGAL